MKHVRQALWVLALFTITSGAGCDGEGDVDAGPAPDGFVPMDDGGTGDAGDPGMCAGVSCMLDAHCVPETGECECDEGFGFVDDVCLELSPDDPALRTEAEVCEAWQSGHVENAGNPWMAGATMCDPGTMPMEAIDDTLRRVNLFRWLAGMPDVTYDGSAHSEMMECAHMMSVNMSLSHDPPMSWTCWTMGGAAAAGRSNIAWGYSSPGDAIDGYMTDVGTMSLGHRRWILGQRLGSVEIGYSEAGSRPGQCLGVFGRGGSTSRTWSAYPNQGFAPIAMVQSRRGVVTWSFQAYDFDLLPTTTVEITEQSSGRVRPVMTYLTGGGGPPPSIGFVPQGWEPSAGETYRITIVGTSTGDIRYETTLVSCP